MEYTNHIESNRDTAVTIGNFDGLHIGHQELIHKMKGYAVSEGLAALVFSFAPHPAAVLNHKPFDSILLKSEKIFLLEEMGVDIFLEYPFDIEFSQVDPQRFLDLLFHSLRCKALVVGEGYRFGKDRAGTAKLIQEIGERQGVIIEIVPHIPSEETAKISSSKIRELILAGDMRKAGAMLSRPYFIMGKVINGKKIGRTIGFPTLNLIPPSFKILPPNGVYATKVLYQNKMWPGVTNVGNKPTIGDGSKTVETYIFGFDRDIYGEEVGVYFYDKLRDEKKFADIDELKNQIAIDTEAAKEVFACTGNI